MAAKRRQILDYIQTRLEQKITPPPSVMVNKAGLTDIDAVAFPAIFVYSSDESREEDGGAIGEETWNWQVVVEAWQQAGDIEELIASIHSALALNDAGQVDCSLGGLVDWIFRQSVSELEFEPTREIRIFTMVYNIRYRHVIGVM